MISSCSSATKERPLIGPSLVTTHGNLEPSTMPSPATHPCTSHLLLPSLARIESVPLAPKTTKGMGPRAQMWMMERGAHKGCKIANRIHVGFDLGRGQRQHDGVHPLGLSNQISGPPFLRLDERAIQPSCCPHYCATSGPIQDHRACQAMHKTSYLSLASVLRF